MSIHIKSLVALTLATAAGVCSAQNVTVYGLVDLSVEHLRSSGATLRRMPGLTGSLPSRIGIRGREDLGSGLSAVFTFEQGFSADTGTLGQGGRAFGRQAFVGLSSGWGTASIGRQYTMLFWSMVDADVMGPGIYSTSVLDSYIPNARADNSVAWMANLHGWTLGATYSVGRDAVNAGPSPAGTNCPGETAGDSRSCRGMSGLVKYDSERWGAALAVDELRGGPGAFGGLAQSSMRDRRLSLNGYARIGSVKVGAGLLRRNNDGSASSRRSDLWYAGASVPLTGSLVMDAQALRLDFEDTPDKATLLAARLTYALSRRTAIYGTVGSIDNDGALALSVSAGGPVPGAGRSQTGIALGLRHAF